MVFEKRYLCCRGDEMIDRKHIPLPENFNAGLSAALVARAALDKGLSVEVVGADIYVIEGNGRTEYFQRTMAGSMSHIARTISDSKPLTKRQFRKNGVSTPRGLTFSRRKIDKAVDFMTSSDCTTFVVKPTDGVLGDMVFMNIDTEQKLREKCDQFPKRRMLMLEEQVEGTECRYFALGDRVVAVAERRPASVVGDGTSTIAELVERKNAGRKGHLALVTIEIDAETRDLLAEQGASVDTVPEQGLVVRLKRVSNISQGGDSVDVTDLVHDDLKQLAVAALQSVPTLLYAGIDVIAQDHMAPLSGQRAVVLELNWFPMVTMHHAPAEGQPRDVAGAIIDYLFFREAPGSQSGVFTGT